MKTSEMEVIENTKRDYLYVNNNLLRVGGRVLQLCYIWFEMISVIIHSSLAVVTCSSDGEA